MQITFGDNFSTTIEAFTKIEIPTKPYIMRYLQHRFDTAVPVLTENDLFGKKLVEILSKKRNDRNTEVAKYSTTMIVGLNKRMFLLWGWSISPTGIKSFNDHVEDLLKEICRNYLDVKIECGFKLVDAIEDFRKKYEIEDEYWDFESIKKDYYRYRQRNDGKLLYNKNV